MSGARPFRMVARMPDDVPRDMRHLCKQFPGRRTFIPSNPREGRRCSLYAASERPRPRCDQHRLILHTNEPGGREVQRAGRPRPGIGPGPDIARQAVVLDGGQLRYEGARPTGRMAEGGQPVPGGAPRVVRSQMARSQMAQCWMPAGWHGADSTVQIAAGRKQWGAKKRPPEPGAPSTARKAEGPHGSRGVLQSPTGNWYATGHLRAL